MKPSLVWTLLSFIAFAAAACGMVTITQAADITVSVVRSSSPDMKGVLPIGQPVFLELDYVSDQPVRFQAKALSDSKEVQYFNATVVYPAGRGTAFAWSSFQGPAVADGVFIGVFDENMKNMIASKTVPAELEWKGAAAATLDTPAWAQDLIAQEAMMAKEQAGAVWPILDNALFLFVVISIPGYLLLQLIAPVKLAGGWRKLALLPLPVMLLAVAHAAYASSIGSSLWVIGILFMMPAAFVWLTGVLVAKRLRPA